MRYFGGSRPCRNSPAGRSTGPSRSPRDRLLSAWPPLWSMPIALHVTAPAANNSLILKAVPRCRQGFEGRAQRVVDLLAPILAREVLREDRVRLAARRGVPALGHSLRWCGRFRPWRRRTLLPPP